MEQLGINLTLVVTQIINFAILFWLLGKFAYKPMLRAMRERRKRIEEGLELASKMQEEKAKQEERTQQIFDKAQERALKVISKARQEGEKEREKILEDARQEAKQVIDEGLKVLQARQEEAQEEMRKELADLVVILSEKFLQEKIDKRKQRQIIARQIEELRKKDVEKIH